MFTFITGFEWSAYVLLTVVLAVILITWMNRRKVKSWGRRLTLLWILGLVLCIVVAYRDSYHLSVMAMTDPSLQGGVFAANSFQSTLCMILGAVNMLTVLSAVIIRKASYREWMFYVLAAAIIIKVLVIESSLLLL